ncbi:PIR protein [Plasmodium vivax]|uniref:VIR protein n=1 Tax=Plasmodium vivax TaxID=5855 RepID=A0A565A563_PLAVI|nr:PIR protein [Plasmodium vivax]
MSEKEPDYSFFDNFESCYKIECEKDEMNYIAPDANYCEGAQFKYNNGNQVVDICKDMVKLFNNAIFKNVIILNPLTENKVPEFINYWINSRLTQSGFNDNIKPEIFPKLNSITHHFDGRGLLKGKIYHIKEKEVDGMNILYELYKNIHEFEQKKTEHFKNFLENFMTNYNKGLIKCFYEGNVKFCQELNKYIEFYEQNKNNKLSKTCDNKKCPSLTKLTILSSASNKEHLNIAKMGSSLLGGLHISSLKELPSMKTQDYSNLKILISLQYNLLMEKEEDDKKCVMMKILKEYLQYFEKNKTNPSIQYFVNEFIDKYYKAKESEYKNIFSSCNPGNTSKGHCKIYNECNDDFKDDMSLIKSGSEKYIKNKEEYFESLGPNKSFLHQALALFQDSEAMSRYSTTIISIIISIFLCSFFLFKFTPLGSICNKKKKRRKIPLFFPVKIEDLEDHNTRHKNNIPKRGKIRFSYQPT